MTVRIIACTNLRIGGQPSCAFRGSKSLADFLEKEIAHQNVDAIVIRTRCMGHCPKGPNFRVAGKEFVHEATEEKLSQLVRDLPPRPD